MTQIRQRICDSVINTYGTTETGSWAGCAVMLPEDYADSDKIASVNPCGCKCRNQGNRPGRPG